MRIWCGCPLLPYVDLAVPSTLLAIWRKQRPKEIYRDVVAGWRQAGFQREESDCYWASETTKSRRAMYRSRAETCRARNIDAHQGPEDEVRDVGRRALLLHHLPQTSPGVGAVNITDRSVVETSLRSSLSPESAREATARSSLPAGRSTHRTKIERIALNRTGAFLLSPVSLPVAARL